MSQHEAVGDQLPENLKISVKTAMAELRPGLQIMPSAFRLPEPDYHSQAARYGPCPVLLFSKLNIISFGHFDAEKIFLDDENT